MQQSGWRSGRWKEGSRIHRMQRHFPKTRPIKLGATAATAATAARGQLLRKHVIQLLRSDAPHRHLKKK